MNTRAGLLVCAGLIIAPLLWALNTQLGQVLPYVECKSTFRLSVLLSSLFILASCLSGWMSWRAVSRRSTGRPVVWFIAVTSALLAAIFAFALTLQALAGIVLTGCER